MQPTAPGFAQEQNQRACKTRAGANRRELLLDCGECSRHFNDNWMRTLQRNYQRRRQKAEIAEQAEYAAKQNEPEIIRLVCGSAILN
jgi:hypothetical protein